MSLPELQQFLLWCAGINFAILLVWFAVFTLCHDWAYRMHGRWFSMPSSTFIAIHYGAMAGYKLAIILFNLVPWAALCLIN